VVSLGDVSVAVVSVAVVSVAVVSVAVVSVDVVSVAVPSGAGVVFGGATVSLCGVGGAVAASVGDGWCLPLPSPGSVPVAAGVVGAAGVVVSVAAVSGVVAVVGVAASAADADASKPLGSLPTLDVTGVSLAVGSVAVLAGGAPSAGPYELDVTDGGAIQLRRSAM
jgi:hypothetical protein